METETQEVQVQEQLTPSGVEETSALESQAAEIEMESAPVEEKTPEVKEIPTEEYSEKVRKRIDEVTWQKYEAQRERDYWKMQAEARLKAEEAAKPEPVAPIAAHAPRQEDFETYEAYDEALFDWRYQQRVARETFDRQKNERERQQQEYAEKMNTWVESGKEKYPDFAQIALVQPQDGGPQITPFMAGAIQDSPTGHEIAYYLGKNQKEALRISRLSPVAQVREIGRLEFKVTSPSQRETTNAPAPTQPVGGKESPVIKLEDMSYEQYREYRIKQIKARGT